MGAQELHERELQAVREQLEGEKQAAVMEERRQAEAVRGELENTKQVWWLVQYICSE